MSMPGTDNQNLFRQLLSSVAKLLSTVLIIIWPTVCICIPFVCLWVTCTWPVKSPVLRHL